ncbi:DNA ligase D, partial [Burkholderia sp. Tr-860]|uniref:DNA ligase D n=1 Tax=Burkholderia sp. Tr-860 TaxID=2608338 RepID=UPI001F041E41
PQLATLVAAPPEGEDWRYEMKFDGYRVLIRIAGRGRRRSVQVFTREGKDWSAKFRRQCAALADLPVNNAWLDAEAVVLDARGLPDFGALQQALSAGEDAAIVFFVFDLPFLDGRALADLPLDTRRERLAACFGDAGGQAVQLSPTLEGEPAELLAAAARAGLEGLIGKRADSPYRAGRGAAWIKLKCRQRQEFVIGGFSEPRSSRSGFGALLLGVHERPAQGRRRAGELAYVGRVGTGFDRRALDAIAARLRKIERSDAPFAVPPAERGDAVHWVEPRLVAECEFAGWTADGLVRQAAFIALREDKLAGQIVRETAAPAGGQPTGGRMRTDHQAPSSRSRGKAANRATGRNDDATVAGVRVTHPERVVDTESGLRKIDVVRYYAAIAEHLLPQLSGRPVSLVRYMKGIDGPSFFQKHAGPRGMGFVTRHPGLDPGHDALITLDDREALVGAAQFDALELPEGYLTEIHEAARAFTGTVCRMLARGAAFFIDYGFPAGEYYHPQRAEGTLMCHYRHRAHGDPFVWPGLQDITAHVEFSGIHEAAVAAGAELLGYTSQGRFLLNAGITEVLAGIDPADGARFLPAANAVQKLIAESEMGELFKVIAFGRGIDGGLAAFARGERSHAL